MAALRTTLFCLLVFFPTLLRGESPQTTGDFSLDPHTLTEGVFNGTIYLHSKDLCVTRGPSEHKEALVLYLDGFATVCDVENNFCMEALQSSENLPACIFESHAPEPRSGVFTTMWAWPPMQLVGMNAEARAQGFEDPTLESVELSNAVRKMMLESMEEKGMITGDPLWNPAEFFFAVSPDPLPNDVVLHFKGDESEGKLTCRFPQGVMPMASDISYLSDHIFQLSRSPEELPCD